LIFLFSILAYAFSVLPLLSLLRIKQFPRYLCAFFVVFIAEIILTGNILGLLRQLNNKELWIIIQFLFFLVSWTLWFRFKRPSLISFKISHPNWRGLHLLQKITLCIMGFFILLGYATLIYLILIVPPNNNDSMVVHLVRVGYWLQHGSFAPWNSLIERQVIYPYNAQIVVLWTILFHGTDLFAAFVQFFCVLFTALGIYGIGRQIGGNRFQSALPALFYLTFPQVILQATTTQDDLVITCFLILGSYFFLHWFDSQYKDNTDLIFTATALMIAVGIKPTAFYFFIGFAIFIIILICIKKMKLIHLLKIGVACLVPFTILSSFAYVNNMIYYHTPLGPADFVSSESGVFTGNIFKKAEINSGRFLYQFFSLDGFPIRLIQKVQDAKVVIASKMPGVFNTTSDFIKDPNKTFSLATPPGINEDYSWFGPVSFLLLIPAYLFGIYKAIKTKDQKIVFLLIVPLFLMLGISVLRPGWDPYQGRYFNPGIAISMPLLALMLNKKRFQEIFIFLFSIMAVAILTFCVLMNDSKPILTQRTVAKICTKQFVSRSIITNSICSKGFDLFPILPAKMDIGSLNSLERETYSSPLQYQIFSEFSNYIPAHARIGLFLLNGDWEYPFFGRNLEYQLVPIIDKTLLDDASWLAQNQVEFLIVHSNVDKPMNISSSYKLVYQIDDSQNNNLWQFYQK